MPAGWISRPLGRTAATPVTGAVAVAGQQDTLDDGLGADIGRHARRHLGQRRRQRAVLGGCSGERGRGVAQRGRREVGGGAVALGVIPAAGNKPAEDEECDHASGGPSHAAMLLGAAASATEGRPHREAAA